jgi:O-antigen biosynthesis protein WbqP
MGLMKRCFDFFLACILLGIFLIPMLFIYILVLFSTDGSVIYFSNRIGKDNKIFSMPKFRTMKKNTPVLATHSLKSPRHYQTYFGSFLRKTSLDELPQIWNILVGEMSFVGPRPALFNQYDLIALRTKANVHKLVPGLTGWAQINGRDEISIREKVNLDVEYLKRQSLYFDIQILWETFVKVIKREGVSH